MKKNIIALLTLLIPLFVVARPAWKEADIKEEKQSKVRTVKAKKPSNFKNR